jgi:hypothetical protein
MARVIPHSAVLVAHPVTDSTAVRRIEARVGWDQDGALCLGYVLNADLERLRIPAPRPPRQADRLWEHTCFEVFLSVKGQSAYHEFNLAPSGEWAVYKFSSYRERAPLMAEEWAPRIAVSSAGNRLELETVIDFACSPAMQACTRLRFGLSAVIEEKNGIFGYWALKHPPGRPDFHHPDGFALEIDRDTEAVNQSSVDKR